MANRGDMPSQSRAESEGDFGRTKRRGGGGKLARSETVTVRLDPKLRYLAELAARKQRRTLSSFIEWAIEENLKTTSEAADLWDVDEPDRFAKLALRYPDMLTHDEQVLWKLIRENGYLWRARCFRGKWKWGIIESSLNFLRLREHWESFRLVARGEADKSILPDWQEINAQPEETDGSDFNDPIPF